MDDIGFPDSISADAATRSGIDRQRSDLTGMSNGSRMAKRYVAISAGKVRAVAGVSGTMDVRATRVTGPVQLLHIHGTADPMIP